MRVMYGTPMKPCRYDDPVVASAQNQTDGHQQGVSTIHLMHKSPRMHQIHERTVIKTGARGVITIIDSPVLKHYNIIITTK